jgi:hypothetical protein
VRAIRRCLLTIAAALALGAAAVPGLAYARHGRSLLVVGDSLAVGTRPYIHHFLPHWRVHQRTSISMHAPEGPAIVRAYGDHLPRVVFANLGTNDDPGAVGSFLHQVRRVLHLAGPHRCVVWASVYRPPVGGRSYHSLNGALARLAQRRRHLVMFRWVRLARAHRYWFGSDGVHPTASGYRVRARHMARDIRTCRRIALHRRHRH